MAASDNEPMAAIDAEPAAASDAESVAASDAESAAASAAESAAASDAESDDTETYVDVLEVGSKADPDKAGVDRSALHQLMGELSKGQTAKWKSAQEIVVEGGLDWLLSADVEVATILRRERLMYAQHSGREPLEVRMSLANQALRQDPALYALAAYCLSNGNTRLITLPIDDSHVALCAEVQLSAGKGDVIFRKRAMAPA